MVKREFDSGAVAKMQCVVVVETSATQDYIFSTNRQAENIGASHLVVQGTSEAFEAYSLGRTDIVPIAVSSGSVIFAAGNPQAAIAAITSITNAAWDLAPGLEVTGAYACRDGQPTTAEEADVLLKDAFRAVRHEQGRKRSLAMRFPVNPLAELCETGRGSAVESAAARGSAPSGPRWLGVAAAAKRAAREDGWRQIARLLDHVELVRSVDAFDEPRDEDDKRWTAVVHADGNSVGQIMQNLITHAGLEGKSAAEYWQTYADISSQLREVTVAALKAAAKNVEVPSKGLLYPVLLGGDDVTVILPGEVAIEFTEQLLVEFSARAADHPLTEGMTMSAGIAIIKPHFPFHVAYRLAEELAESAKNVTRNVGTSDGRQRPEPTAAIDFHIVHDASPSTLKGIRKRMEVDCRRLTAKPLSLADLHQTHVLAKRLGGISASTLHSLRESLFRTGDPAPAFELARVRHSTMPTYDETLAAHHSVGQNSKDPLPTRFLDALELSGLET